MIGSQNRFSKQPLKISQIMNLLLYPGTSLLLSTHMAYPVSCKLDVNGLLCIDMQSSQDICHCKRQGSVEHGIN